MRLPWRRQCSRPAGQSVRRARGDRAGCVPARAAAADQRASRRRDSRRAADVGVCTAPQQRWRSSRNAATRPPVPPSRRATAAAGIVAAVTAAVVAVAVAVLLLKRQRDVRACERASVRESAHVRATCAAPARGRAWARRSARWLARSLTRRPRWPDEGGSSGAGRCRRAVAGRIGPGRLAYMGGCVASHLAPRTCTSAAARPAPMDAAGGRRRGAGWRAGHGIGRQWRHGRRAEPLRYGTRRHMDAARGATLGSRSALPQHGARMRQRGTMALDRHRPNRGLGHLPRRCTTGLAGGRACETEHWRRRNEPSPAPSDGETPIERTGGTAESTTTTASSRTSPSPTPPPAISLPSTLLA